MRTELYCHQDFNIRVGAEFFVATLASNGGDVFSTIGEYNGWKPGMTYVGDELLTEIVYLI